MSTHARQHSTLAPTLYGVSYVVMASRASANVHTFYPLYSYIIPRHTTIYTRSPEKHLCYCVTLCMFICFGYGISSLFICHSAVIRSRETETETVLVLHKGRVAKIFIKLLLYTRSYGSIILLGDLIAFFLTRKGQENILIHVVALRYI